MQKALEQVTRGRPIEQLSPEERATADEIVRGIEEILRARRVGPPRPTPMDRLRQEWGLTREGQ
jgi:hypothetical protein